MGSAKKSLTIDEWESKFDDQIKKYAQFIVFLEQHTRFITSAAKDLTEYPPEGFRTIQQQKQDAKISPFAKGTRRRSQKRVNRFLKTLENQTERIKTDIGIALGHLPQ